MLEKRHVVMVFLTFCLAIALFMGATTSQVLEPFDPWFDAYDDGKTNYEDLFYLADRYGASGTPINKTELLCCLTGGNISVPTAAFEPTNRSYQLYGYEYIENWEDHHVRCLAPVQLPDGATVTNLTSYWYDAGFNRIECYLTSYNNTVITRDLAWAHSSGDTGDGSNYATTIKNAIVDNGKYAYMLEVGIPSSFSHQDYKFYYAVIEWEYPTLP